MDSCRDPELKVSFVQPRPELRPYTSAFWVFQSALGVPQNDVNLAAPNGCPKLIILCDNSLETTADGHTTLDREGLYFIGNRDSATFVHSAPRKTTIIGIEFRPHGAFPVFGIPLQESANRVLDWESVFGSRGGEVWETFRNLPTLSSKLAFIQAQLVRLLDRNHRDNRLMNFCVNSLELTNGRMTIRELEQKTGYTHRYLELLFYDQAHFTKEFKRMTGHSPRNFILHVHNDFGRRLSLK